MKRFFISNALPLLFVAALVLMPLLVGAAQTSGPTGGFQTGGPTGGFQTSGPTGQTGGFQGYSVDNPLKFGSFCQLLKGILAAIVAVGIPVAILFLVWVGFKFILARGDTTALAEARRNFLYTVIGIAIFLGAWVIAQIIAATVQQFGITILSCQ